MYAGCVGPALEEDARWAGAAVATDVLLLQPLWVASVVLHRYLVNDLNFSRGADAISDSINGEPYPIDYSFLCP